MKNRIFISIFCDNICVMKNIALDIDLSANSIESEAKILIEDISNENNTPIGKYTYKIQ